MTKPQLELRAFMRPIRIHTGAWRCPGALLERPPGAPLHGYTAINNADAGEHRRRGPRSQVTGDRPRSDRVRVPR